MKKTLIFHIGAHRTATSSLQQFLFQNRAALKTAGILYPYKVRRHVELINKLFQKEKTPETVSKTLLARMAKHTPALDTVILSDEDICMRRNLNILAQFRAYFDVKIVFSLRRQDLWLESWFLQNIKWQWDPTLSHASFAEFMAQRERFHWIDYDGYLQHLEELFGRENIILNLFEKQQMPQGPIQMFCDSIGLEISDAFRQTRAVNPSFSPLMSEFVRHLPMDQASPKYRRVLTKACAEVDKTLHSGGKSSSLLLPHDERAQVQSAYAAGNRAVAQRYFDREELFFDPLPGPEVELANMQLPQDTEVLMQRFVTPVFEQLVAGDKELQGPTSKHVANQPSLLRSVWRRISG